MARPSLGQTELRQLLDRATGAHQQGKLADAERCYRQFLAARPDHFEAQYMFGVLRYQQGRHADARESVAAALRLKPDWVEAWLLDGLILQRQERHVEALASFDRALAIRPSYVEALTCRGNVLDGLGRHAEAIASYDRALAVSPGDAGLHYNRGNALRTLERFDDALASYDRAIAIAPGGVEALTNRGEVLLALERPRDALASFERALTLRPDYVEALNNRGVALAALGRDQEALASYQRAIAIRPDGADIYNNRGNLLMSLGRLEEALASFERAVVIRPDSVESLSNRGNCLHAMNRWPDALRSYDQALALAPENGKVRFAACVGQLPALYAHEAEIAERRAAYEERLRALCAEAERDERLGELAKGIGAHQPFYLAYQGGNDRGLQALYGALVCRIMAHRYPPATLAERPGPGEPVRVGIVSGYFSNHSNWKIPIKGWLSQLDRRQFHVCGYYTGCKRDADTELAEALCQRFVQGPLSIERWRAEIGADRPHVLIYPEVGMDQVCMQLAAQRLAPVQCNSWGHPDTSGFPTLDYYLSSDLMEPSEADAHYTERLVRLPNLSIYYEPSVAPDVPVARAELGLRADATVYWCGQSLYKYLPQYDQVFARIAREAGDCQFAFIEHPKSPQVTAAFRARLERAFAALGLRADDYLVFWPPFDAQRFVAAIGACDIVLDSIGWSGCNSTLESLPNGLPIVTMTGGLMRGRHTMAILRMMDVTETIVATLDDYVATAARLARDQAWRAGIKGRMLANRDRVYRDETCIASLQEFLNRVARSGE